MVNVTSRKRAQNHKVDHLFSHIIQVSAEVFEPVCNISSGKQDVIFQGHHEDKHQVTFKCAGDGFLIDKLCEYGYTITSIQGMYPHQSSGLRRGIQQLTPKLFLC